jgi:hypothetical protein
MNYTLDDIKSIKLTQTHLEFIIHYIYFTIIRYFIRYKKIYDNVILYDNGIEIDKSFIPYEYIVSIRHMSDHTNLVILAKKEEDGTLVPYDSILTINLKNKYLANKIKSNLYYHLKYNDVNLDILTFNSIKVSIIF